MNNRSTFDFKVVRFPKGFEEEDRGLNVCCDPFEVFASTTDPTSWKNDFEGVYVKGSDPTDVITIEIFKCPDLTAPLPNLGSVINFPRDTSVKAFEFDWKLYLQDYGPGEYVIKISYTISGLQGGYEWGKFQLYPYGQQAKGTVRMIGEYNSFLQDENVNFTDSGFRRCVRARGIFEYSDPRPDVRNHVDTGFSVVKSKRDFVSEYQLRTEVISICKTRVLEHIFLCEDGILATDNNPFNHSYLIHDLPVVYESHEIPPVDFDRRRKITAKFGLRQKIKRSNFDL